MVSIARSLHQDLHNLQGQVLRQAVMMKDLLKDTDLNSPAMLEVLLKDTDLNSSAGVSTPGGVGIFEK